MKVNLFLVLDYTTCHADVLESVGTAPRILYHGTTPDESA